MNNFFFEKIKFPCFSFLRHDPESLRGRKKALEAILGNSKHHILAFSLGLLSTITQVVFLRELVVVFYGNETAYAVIFASWLFWIAMGSFCLSLWGQKRNRSWPGFLVAQAALFFISPLTLILIRGIKSFMNIHVGEALGLFPMSATAFIILAPVTFLFGATFVLICHLPLQESKKKSLKDISGIYGMEAVGAAIGGVLVSLLLFLSWTSFAIIFFLGGVNLTVIFLFSPNRKFLRIFLAMIIGVTCLAFFSGQVRKIDIWSRQRQWQGLKLLAVEDSIYGNIAVTRLGDAYSLFENGLLSFSTNDSFASEELVHYALLAHPSPRQILLVGNGLDGSLEELLKYPHLRVDYIQLDAKVDSLAKEIFPKEHAKPLDDPRVTIFYEDARFFIKRAAKRYDVVLMNISEPQTAFVNRYYTVEFYEEARKILQEEGLIALRVPSSENYLSKANRSFLRSIHSTLQKVYPDVQSIPGDMNIFLAGNQAKSITRDAHLFARRFKERGISTQYVRPEGFPYKLSESRVSYIDNILEEKGSINSDTKPIAYFYNIVLWSTHFNKAYKRFIEQFLWVNIYHLLLIPLVIFIIGKVFFSRKPSQPVLFSIVTTGFSEILFQLMVILSFQSLYGYAYHRIGLMIAFFMFGLYGGTLKAKRVLQENRRIFAFYKATQVNIAMYPIGLIFIYYLFRGIAHIPILGDTLSFVYTFLPFLAGYWGGVQYPLAITLLSESQKTKSQVPRTAGFVYAADVLGATCGAILIATVLLPLFGINAMAFFSSALSFSVFLWMRATGKQPGIKR